MSVLFILGYVVRRLDKCKDKALFLNEKLQLFSLRKTRVMFVSLMVIPFLIYHQLITNNGIFMPFSNLKVHKASGPDGIPPHC